jgi:hypothetical protein
MFHHQLKGISMNCQTIPLRKAHPRSRPTSNLLLLVTMLLFLCIPPMVNAKPQINISTSAAGGGVCPFYLWWNTTGNVAWPNYIVTELYDCNGSVIAGYPQEDPNTYYIPANQIGKPATATGSEPDQATNACTVVVSVSGEWNADTSNPEPVGSPACCDEAAIRRARNSRKSTLQNVTIVEAETRAAGPHKYEVWLSINNPSNKNVTMNFVYAIFKKADPNNDALPLIPITYPDKDGNPHVFRRLNHAGQSRYVIPPSPLPTGGQYSDLPTVLKDLRIDLSQGVDPNDYVYVDIFAVDNTNLQNFVVPRIQIKTGPNSN